MGVRVYLPELDITIFRGFIAAVVAIIFELLWIKEVKLEKAITSSDSVSALNRLISKGTARDHLLVEISMILIWIETVGVDVHFCRVAAHNEIKGNEKA